MKKIALILSFVMIFTLAFSLSSCGDDSSGGITGGNSTGDSSTRTITGLDGSVLTVPSDISKVVSLSPSVTLIMSGLGIESKLIGIDSESASLANAPSVEKVSASDVAALSPDVVFAPSDMDVSSIEAAGIPVVKIPFPQSITGISDIIRITGRVMNCSDAAESMSTTMTNVVNVSHGIMTTKYDFFLDLGDLKTTGSGTYLSEVISSSGGANIFSSKEGIITVTDEEVIAANPEFIFTLGSAEDITGRDGWENIDAVANGNVYELPSSEIVYASQNITATVQFIYEKILDVKG